MKHNGFADLIADRPHRVERCHRLLKDHGDLVAAHAAHLCIGQLEKITTIESDTARDNTPWRIRHQPQNRQRRHAFAAARFTDNGQLFAGLERKRNIVHRFDHTLPDEEIGFEPLYFQYGLRRC